MSCGKGLDNSNLSPFFPFSFNLAEKRELFLPLLLPITIFLPPLLYLYVLFLHMGFRPAEELC
jgi:hypothetical protein